MPFNFCLCSFSFALLGRINAHRCETSFEVALSLSFFFFFLRLNSSPNKLQISIYWRLRAQSTFLWQLASIFAILLSPDFPDSAIGAKNHILSFMFCFVFAKDGSRRFWTLVQRQGGAFWTCVFDLMEPLFKKTAGWNAQLSLGQRGSSCRDLVEQKLGGLRPGLQPQPRPPPPLTGHSCGVLLPSVSTRILQPHRAASAGAFVHRGRNPGVQMYKTKII